MRVRRIACHRRLCPGPARTSAMSSRLSRPAPASSARSPGGGWRARCTSAFLRAVRGSHQVALVVVADGRTGDAEAPGDLLDRHQCFVRRRVRARSTHGMTGYGLCSSRLEGTGWGGFPSRDAAHQGSRPCQTTRWTTFRSTTMPAASSPPTPRGDRHRGCRQPSQGGEDRSRAPRRRPSHQCRPRRQGAQPSGCAL